MLQGKDCSAVYMVLLFCLHFQRNGYTNNLVLITVHTIYSGIVSHFVHGNCFKDNVETSEVCVPKIIWI